MPTSTTRPSSVPTGTRSPANVSSNPSPENNVSEVVFVELRVLGSGLRPLYQSWRPRVRFLSIVFFMTEINQILVRKTMS